MQTMNLDYEIEQLLDIIFELRHVLFFMKQYGIKKNFEISNYSEFLESSIKDIEKVKNDLISKTGKK